MSFVRSGRVRLFICVSLLVFVFGMVYLWNQIKEQQQQNLHCEQQQQALNERMQSMVEHKFTLEKNHEHERTKTLELRRNFEIKLIDYRLKYEKLEQSYKILKSQYDNLMKDCEVTRKQQSGDINNLEIKLQSIQSALQKENLNAGEMEVWKQKYEIIRKEKELLMNAGDRQKNVIELQKHVKELEMWLLNCTKAQNQILEQQQQIKKPPNMPNIFNDGKMENGQNKAQIQKSFNTQDTVSLGLYHIAVERPNSTDNTNPTSPLAHIFPSQSTNIYNMENDKRVLVNTQKVYDINDGDGSLIKVNPEKDHHNFMESNKSLSFSAPKNHSLILNSVENFQIVPKSINNSKQWNQQKLTVETISSNLIKNDPILIPHQTTTKATNKSDNNGVVLQVELLQVSNVSSTSSAGLPPLAIPPNQQRKLPDNVAPIPDMIINDPEKRNEKNEDKIALGVVNRKSGEYRNNEKINDNNNRYTNIVNDINHKSEKREPAEPVNKDATGQKHNFINDANFNVIGEDGNFFDSDKQIEAGADNNDKRPKMSDNDDDGILAGDGRAAAGDINLKNQNLLDANNLNNEVAGDQGKEFLDGIRIEDGNDEDEDEDDYSNLAPRQQGGQAIRH